MPGPKPRPKHLKNTLRRFANLFRKEESKKPLEYTMKWKKEKSVPRGKYRKGVGKPS